MAREGSAGSDWRRAPRAAAVIGGLAAVIALSWAYLLVGAGVDVEMMDMGGGRMMAMPPGWTAGYAAVIFVMWTVMMAAMMLPSAGPAILLVAALARQRNTGRASATAGLFASGYLVIWIAFSVAATVTQWALDKAGLLSATMAAANRALAGSVLIAAGLHEWTPLKHTCLRHCRSPVEFLVGHWGRGGVGAALTGIRHGLFCLGCCWMLMAPLFVGGPMNLAWIAAIALIVLIEKLLPFGVGASRFIGIVLAAWGIVALATGFSSSNH